MRITARIGPVQICLAAALALLLVACESQPEKIDKSTRQVASWLASARFIAETWLAGSAPSQYAGHALRTAAEQLQEQSTALSKLPGAEAQRQVVSEATAVVNRMASAVQAGERGRAQEALRPLVSMDERMRGEKKEPGAR
jgi:thioredoxin-like negative regulator of GroEL